MDSLSLEHCICAGKKTNNVYLRCISICISCVTTYNTPSLLPRIGQFTAYLFFRVFFLCSKLSTRGREHSDLKPSPSMIQLNINVHKKTAKSSPSTCSLAGDGVSWVCISLLPTLVFESDLLLCSAEGKLATTSEERIVRRRH